MLKTLIDERGVGETFNVRHTLFWKQNTICRASLSPLPLTILPQRTANGKSSNSLIRTLKTPKSLSTLTVKTSDRTRNFIFESFRAVRSTDRRVIRQHSTQAAEVYYISVLQSLSKLSEPIKFSVVPPGEPTFNVEVDENDTVKVPAGADYSISCGAEGFPEPKIWWIDEHGTVGFEKHLQSLAFQFVKTTLRL